MNVFNDVFFLFVFLLLFLQLNHPFVPSLLDIDQLMPVSVVE